MASHLRGKNPEFDNGTERVLGLLAPPPERFRIETTRPVVYPFGSVHEPDIARQCDVTLLPGRCLVCGCRVRREVYLRTRDGVSETVRQQTCIRSRNSNEKRACRAVREVLS